MTYVIILIILTLMVSSVRFSIIEKSLPISHFLHHQCLNTLPENSHFYAELAALVCGHNFESAGFVDLYKSTGLIHLFVVSGSHFILLKNILQHGLSFLTLKKQTYCVALILTGYSFVCLNNPPVVRGLLTFLMHLALKNKNIFWPSHTVLYFVGLLGILLNYKWANSLSFQMSWIASLALLILGDHLDMKSLFKRQFVMFSVLSVCYALMGSPQISSVICSVIFTPILELFLFPLALLTTVFHFFEPLFHLAMASIQKLLLLFEFRTVSGAYYPDSSVFIKINWILILSLHIFLILKQRTENKVAPKNLSQHQRQFNL